MTYMGDACTWRGPELSFRATPYLGDASAAMRARAVLLSDAILRRRLHDDDSSSLLGRRHTWEMPS